MGKLVEEYQNLLASEKDASEKFGALQQRIRQDERSPGVLLQNVRRSSMDMHILLLLQNSVISLTDLADFSQELQEKMHFMMKNWT